MKKSNRPRRAAPHMLLMLLCLGVGPAWADKPAPLDPRQAAALWQDARWQAFLAAMTSGLNMRCEVPPASATLAREIGPRTADPPSAPSSASPDWRSRHHELLLSCSGQQGVRGVRVRAEFLPMVSEPINLELGILFQR